MADRPRIGVTGNGKRWSPSWWCIRLALRLCGAQAVRISTRHTPPEAPLHALVISGGDDIAPEHYGGDMKAQVKLDPERDQLEINWIRRALQDDMPLLGICRGAQLINVVLGGDLHQDIRHMRVHTNNRPGILATKLVHLEKGSDLSRFLRRERIRVNSLHHQAVNRVADALVAVARDRDGIIQAVESAAGRQVIGVQWHPEYLFYLPVQLALFRGLVNRAD